MLRPVFKGVVKNGAFVPENKDKFRSFLCAREGKVLECVFRPETKLKSDSQRRYYWAVIIPILCEATGYGDFPNTALHPGQMHNYIKEMFYPKINILGREVPVEGKSMTTIETEEMYTRIREWAFEFLNCYIPLPNEVEY